jgi:hypothetical protein
MRLDEQPGPWLLLTQLIPASSFQPIDSSDAAGHVKHFFI